MYKNSLIICSGLVLMGFLWGSTALTLECPPPPEQVKKDWEVDVNTVIARIGPVKGGELRTRTRNATQDLLTRLPDAGRVYLEQMMYSAYCSALRDDKTIKESEKAKLLKEYNREVRNSIANFSSGKDQKKQKFNRTQVQLKQPTFTEKVDKVVFSLGERGFSSGYNFADLEKAPREPFMLNGFSPVRVYIKEGKPYADVKVYGGSGLPPIEIKNNQLSNKPIAWDFNSNENALEIVDDKSRPMYQFFYKSPSHIVVNGIFPFPGGLILANDEGAAMNPTLPTTFALKRIFMYPSWKYPGKFDDKSNR